MRPRLHAFLVNEIGLLSSAPKSRAAAQEHSASNSKIGFNSNWKGALIDTSLAFSGAKYAGEVDTGSISAGSAHAAAESRIPTTGTGAPWDYIAALPGRIADMDVAQPDRVAYDIVLRALRNAASIRLVDHERALSRCIVAFWETAVSLIQRIASSGRQDPRLLTWRWLPALIGVLAALARCNVPVPLAQIETVWNLISKVLDQDMLVQLDQTFEHLQSEPSLGKFRQKVQNYWHRAPFSADRVYVQCLTFVRNALILHILEHQPSSADLNRRPWTTIRQENSSNFVAESPLLTFSPTVHLDKEPAAHQSPNSEGSSYDAWQRLLSTQGLCLKRLDVDGFPANLIERIANTCIQHCLQSDSSETMTIDLQLCTISCALSQISVSDVVSIHFNMFRNSNLNITACPADIETNSEELNDLIARFAALTAAADSLYLLDLSQNMSDAVRTQIQAFVMDLLTRPDPALCYAAQIGGASLPHAEDPPHTHRLIAVHEDFQRAVCRVLASTSLHSSDECVSALLYKLIRNASGDASQAKFDACCLALRATACAIPRLNILDIVLPFLMQKMALSQEAAQASPSSLARNRLSTLACLDHLSEIALHASLETFSEVARFISRYSQDHRHDEQVTTAILKAVMKMADCVNLDQQREILHALLGIFNDRASYRWSQISPNAPVDGERSKSQDRFDDCYEFAKQSLVTLLQIISKVCRSIEVNLNAHAASEAPVEVLLQQRSTALPSFVAATGTLSQLNAKHPDSDPHLESSILGMFKSLWYFVVILDLVGNEKAQDYIVSIALFAPFLKFSSVIESYFQSNQHKTHLLQLVPSSFHTAVNALSSSEALYLVAMFNIMCCCAAEGKLCVLALLEKMAKHKQLLKTFAQLMCNVAGQFFYAPQPQRRAQIVNILVEHSLNLMQGCDSLHVEISETCIIMLTRLLTQQPLILYDCRVMKAALSFCGTVPQINAIVENWAVNTARCNSCVVLLGDNVLLKPTRPLPLLSKLPRSWIARLNWHVVQLSQARGATSLICSTYLEQKCHELALLIRDRPKLVKPTPPPSIGRQRAENDDEGLDDIAGDWDCADELDVNIVKTIYQILDYLVERGPDMNLLKAMVHLPLQRFTRSVIRGATLAWTTLLHHRPPLESPLMLLLERGWHLYVFGKRGLFDCKHPIHDPLGEKINYSGEKYDVRSADAGFEAELACICSLFEFTTDRVDVSQGCNSGTLPAPLLQLLLAASRHEAMSSHPGTRAARFAVSTCALQAANHPLIDKETKNHLLSNAIQCALHWFKEPPKWVRPSARGGMGAAVRAAISHMLKFWRASANSAWAHTHDGKLLHLLVANEMLRIAVWAVPDAPPAVPEDVALAGSGAHITSKAWNTYIRMAWNVHPSIAYNMAARFQSPAAAVAELERLTLARAQMSELHDCRFAIPYLLTPTNLQRNAPELRYLAYWTPLPPLEAINLFNPRFRNNPLVLQYALRSLFAFPILSVFFFVPQIVQALRHDDLGYVQQYILRAAKTSPIFAHQIIWNMKANMYKDEAATEQDSFKPVFDSIITQIIASFSPEDGSFYEREFDFFNKITSISGKLKPYIKKSKAEKKKKIDEELALIKADAGCYLPSNPESKVLAIDYASGRPLQSHAKAPFLAKFLIEREVALPEESADGTPKTEQLWQCAIFKVGDDCRQDVLALQLIALFKSVYHACGLDLYLFPYCVVATAPGCGVIEVIPDSMSRDMMGREKINSLYDYFVAKFGLPHSPAFQQAQENFITSVAGSSVVLYLLQIKDRHNGNIMLDDRGHLLHVDFGFILDISPGGINFESSPFKLTSEMIAVIGAWGTPEFTTFQRHVVRAFLAIRPYAEAICELVQLMAESGLPCFRGEGTLKRLRSRFVLDKSDRDAAKFMLNRIKESYENRRTVLYDKFQKSTNGIPY